MEFSIHIYDTHSDKTHSIKQHPWMGFSVLTMAFQVRRPSVALHSSCFIFSIFTCVYVHSYYTDSLDQTDPLVLLKKNLRPWVKEVELPPTALSTESGRPKPDCKAHRHTTGHGLWKQARTGELMGHSVPSLISTHALRGKCSHKITTTRDLGKRKHLFLSVSLCVSLCGHVYM